MDAAIRTAVRRGVEKGWEWVGIRGSYSGLIEGAMIPLDVRAVRRHHPATRTRVGKRALH